MDITPNKKRLLGLVERARSWFAWFRLVPAYEKMVQTGDGAAFGLGLLMVLWWFLPALTALVVGKGDTITFRQSAKYGHDLQPRWRVNNFVEMWEGDRATNHFHHRGAQEASVYPCGYGKHRSILETHLQPPGIACLPNIIESPLAGAVIVPLLRWATVFWSLSTISHPG